VSRRTKSIILDSILQKDKYNILTFDTHERYQTQLAKTGHNFYSISYQGAKEWDSSFANKPSNYYTLPKSDYLPSIDFDFILSQSKFGQFQFSSQLKRQLGVPVLSLEHTLPIESWPEQQLQAFKMMTGDVNVFISEYSAGEWAMNCDNLIVHHSVDTELFCPASVEKDGKILSVANDFEKRDYCLNFSGWKRITEGMPVKLVGDNPGLSNPANGVEDLVEKYQSASIFLNTSTISPIPTSLLEAMSCGCPVVSTATCMIPEIITNGENGFISNDEEELKGYIKQLLDDPSLAAKMGDAARKTVIEKFSEEKFINNWNEIFDLTYRMKK